MHGISQKLISNPPKKGLSLRTIDTLVQAAKPGMWVHERGLCLAVAKSGTAFWALRYSTKSGKRRLMKLDDYEPIDAAALKALEWKAADLRKQIKAGRDPLAERNAETKKPVVEPLAVTSTFEEVAKRHFNDCVRMKSCFAGPISESGSKSVNRASALYSSQRFQHCHVG